jgi:hypothetical protein
MVTLQAHRGLIKYKDEGAKEGLLAVLSGSIERYRVFARHIRTLENTWGMTVVSSVLEQPLMGCLAVDGSAATVENEQELKTIAERIQGAILRAPARAAFFEKWRYPPLGLMVLGDVQTLEGVPKAIAAARDRFAPLRQTVARIQVKKEAAISQADEFSAEGERAAREVSRLELELKEAYAAFDDEIQVRRDWGRRTEVVFNVMDYAIAIAEGIGFGFVGELAKVLGLKRRAILQRVPGLFRAASFVRATDEVMVTGVVDRLLRAKPEDLKREAHLLKLALEHGQSYCDTNPGHEPAAMNVVQLKDDEGGTTEVSDRLFWQLMVTSEQFRELYLPT